MMKLLLLLCVSSLASVDALSCAFQQTGPFTLTNALHAANISVVARVGRDITPPVVPVQPVTQNVGNDTHPELVFFHAPMVPGWNPPKYYTGRFRNVLGTDEVKEGRVIFKAGLPCGFGALETATSYLLFGTIANEQVEGYVGEVPVFTPYGHPYKQKKMSDISREDRKVINAFDKGARTCGPSDCSLQLAFPVELCPDGVSTAGQSATCAYLDNTQACGYEYSVSTCPTCTVDDDCSGDLVCNTDGVCSI